MSEFTKKTSHPCWAEFECYYKINDTCTYWEKVKAMLSRLQEEQHKGASCCLGLIDIFQEPCFELDEDGRKRGIGNGFGYKE
jgi:hypothetical protein